MDNGFADAETEMGHLRAHAGGRSLVRDVGRCGEVSVPPAVPVARVLGAVLVRRAGLRWRPRCWWRSRLPSWSASRSTSCLRELGAADLSGAGAAFGAVTQLGPLVTVLIVAGAGATAMCADLGSRTIREEIDAMEVLGINPVQRLVTPRMLASGLVALLLNSLVVHHRHPGRLHILGVCPRRQSRCVRRGYHLAHRRARGDHFVRQGSPFRPDRRFGRLLSRACRSPAGAQRLWATRSTKPWCMPSCPYSSSTWSSPRSASR